MRILKLLASVLLLNVVCGQAIAHHAFVTHFDASKTFEFKGTVVDFKLRNPHSFIFVETQNKNGEAHVWEVETASGVHLRRMGITAKTFEPGEQIQVTAWPNRIPGKNLVYGIHYIEEGGQAYGQHPDLRVDSVAQSAENTKNIVGIKAIVGRWNSPLPFKNPQPPLPLNEAGRLAMESYDPQRSPANTCEPSSVPDLQIAPYLTDIQIEEDQVVFTHELYGITRTIPLNTSPAKVESTGYFGVAHAYLTDDELIIESSGYPVSKWGLSGAAQPKGSPVDIPSSTQKKVIEHYSVSDNGKTLTLHYSMEDPTYLTAIYHGKVTMGRVADDQPMLSYECDTDSASRFSE